MDLQHADQIAAEFGVRKAYDSDAALLADPEVEAVYIASPANCHARQIKLAAAAGKHVLWRKTAHPDPRRGPRRGGRCRRHAVFLQEGYMMKFTARTAHQDTD